MRRNSLISAAAVLAAAAVLCLACIEAKGEEPTVIRIHPSGREIPAGDAGPAAEKLVRRIVARFESADDVLRLAVGEELIRDVRRQRAVELLFAPPRALTLKYNGRQLAVRALLVPLEGELAGGRTLLFYATGDSYASGPMSHPAATDDLEELVAEVLAKSDQSRAKTMAATASAWGRSSSGES